MIAFSAANIFSFPVSKQEIRVTINKCHKSA